MISRNISKKINREFTAALAFTASVAVILLFFTSCGNNTDKRVVLNNVEDSLAYSMGSMQDIAYKFYVETSCNVDSIYRDVCFEGIEKGYKDTVNTIAYYDGISIGIQIMNYYSQKDSSVVNKNFVDGLLDGGLEKNPKTTFDKDADSEQYKQGLENSRIVKDYIAQIKYEASSLGKFAEGFSEGANTVGKPEKYAYACGLVFGGVRLKQALNAVNLQIYGNDSTKSVSKDLFYAGLFECKKPDAIIPHNKANEVSVLSDLKIKDSLYSDNRIEGEEFLKQNATKEGVVTLSSGLQYKIIKKGNGKTPTIEDKVEVNYSGKTIDGNVFEDSSVKGKAVPMRVDALIPGFKEALCNMNEGSVWEIYIPQRMAYGSTQTRKIKPFSTLVFKLELVKIIK